jgi:hypothetical protein
MTLLAGGTVNAADAAEEPAREQESRKPERNYGFPHDRLYSACSE